MPSQLAGRAAPGESEADLMEDLYWYQGKYALLAVALLPLESASCPDTPFVGKMVSSPLESIFQEQVPQIPE